MTKSLSKHVELFIDDAKVTVAEGSTILQAASAAGVEVPVFCYHERLSIAGNCRMCLVQVEGQAKPVASCAMPVSAGMKVQTKTPYVKECREGALEFLLLHHPLDCPICDQGGECDLQDITVAYGRSKSRYGFYKRAVSNKDFGPLIKTEMNRCIHCTRCVRFATEVVGVPHLGAVGRGEHTEIVSMLDKPFASELSGNVIDLCPVGALTSKPYAFKARPWELHKTESIDVMDALGAHIRVDTRGGEVMRILPRTCEAINEEWLSDKARFAYDGLKVSRLDRPYVRDASGTLREASWEDAIACVAKKLNALEGHEIGAVAGDMVDLESLFCLKKFLDFVESPHKDSRQEGGALPALPRCAYTLNTPLARFEEADFALLVGVNPRTESPLLNARLRKAYAHGDLETVVLGPSVELGYPATHLGDDATLLRALREGKHEVCAKLKKAKKPVVLIGSAALARPDGASILAACHDIATMFGMVRDDWCGFNVLQQAASRVGALDIGFLPGTKGLRTNELLAAARQGNIKALYLMAADEIDVTGLEKTFVIYQGHHGEQGAKVADVIFPGSAYTEKDGTYVNAEGRPQRACRATPPPGEALADWQIVARLAEAMKMKHTWTSFQAVNSALCKEHAFLATLGTLPQASFTPFVDLLNKSVALSKDPLTYGMTNFYTSNIIARHSPTMAACSDVFVETTKSEAAL